MLYEHHPLGGLETTVHKVTSLNVRVTADCARFSLRIDPRQAAQAAKALGSPLPSNIGDVTQAKDKLAVRLGPDEWHLIVPLEQQGTIEAAFAKLYATAPHSLVDVSHREVGIYVEGVTAVLALRSAVAFDIEVMPAGTGCRTIFDKAQIILVREAEDRFRIEVWRSFADHVWGILQAASREIALDI